MSFRGFCNHLRDFFSEEIQNHKDEKQFGTGPRAEFLAGMCHALSQQDTEKAEWQKNEERLRNNPPDKSAPKL
jgi:hypothetical protein